MYNFCDGMANPKSVCFQAVMAEARSQQAAAMTEFHWLGHIFPISNAKTRVAILKGW